VRRAVRRDAPHLERSFDVFAQEARAARAWLAPSLQRLAPRAEVLEVGAGLMLLSCQLAKEGFAVTALEPIGQGFVIANVPARTKAFFLAVWEATAFLAFLGGEHASLLLKDQLYLALGVSAIAAGAVLLALMPVLRRLSKGE